MYIGNKEGGYWHWGWRPADGLTLSQQLLLARYLGGRNWRSRTRRWRRGGRLFERRRGGGCGFRRWRAWFG